jgi:UDP-N-acetylmuramoyl-tripeptide--D-alanyl-D-alanine ligase
LVDIVQSLQKVKNAPGRLNVLPGIKNSIIIDDSYKGSVDATLLALRALSQFQDGYLHPIRKIAVLGDMYELGKQTESAHNRVGAYVMECSVDVLIVVGMFAHYIEEGALSAGFSKDMIFKFDTSDQAKKFVQSIIEEGDVILVKGSQGIRMEKIVKEIMAEPLRASELLVRQSRDWLER